MTFPLVGRLLRNSTGKGGVPPSIWQEKIVVHGSLLFGSGHDGNTTISGSRTPKKLRIREVY
jgi:hypothetical protein